MRTTAEIGLAVGAVLNRRKVAKHFVLDIAHRHFGFRRDAEKIAEEARLDGFYVIRTSVPADQACPVEEKPFSVFRVRCQQLVDLRSNTGKRAGDAQRQPGCPRHRTRLGSGGMTAAVAMPSRLPR